MSRRKQRIPTVIVVVLCRVSHGEVDTYKNSNIAPRALFASKLENMTSEPAQIHIEKYVSGHIEIVVNALQDGWQIVRERLYPDSRHGRQ